MKLTIEQFEKGDFDYKEWTSHLENGVGKALASRGLNKTQIYKKVEKALSKSKSKITGDKEDVKLDQEQKDYVLDLVMANQPDLQVILFNTLMNHPEGRKYKFFIDADRNTIVFYETGKKEKSTVEVISLANETELMKYVTGSMHIVDPLKTSTKMSKLLVEYMRFNRELYSRCNVEIISEPKDILTYTTKLIPEIKPYNTYLSGDIPNWCEFLSRCSDPEAFAAWIWSVYEQEHRGRQMLYLYGEQGEDGKTTVQDTLREMFGPEYTAAISSLSSVSTQSTFGSSGIYGKRLLIVPDLRNTNLLKFPIINQLTGGDTIKIEFKNQTPFSAKLNVRIFACSNIEQDIEDKVHDVSRMLHISVSPPSRKTPNWIEGLKKEYWMFLQYAKLCYMKKCPTHYHIECSTSEKYLSSATKRDNTGWGEMVERWFDIDPERSDWYINKHDIFDYIPPRHAESVNSRKAITTALIRCGIKDLEKEKGVQINKQRYMIRGIRPKVVGNGTVKKELTDEEKQKNFDQFTEILARLEEDDELLENDCTE